MLPLPLMLITPIAEDAIFARRDDAAFERCC